MIFDLKPVGFVKNNIKNRSEMTISGTESIIEISPEYSSALDSIEDNSHIIVCCFLNQAKRDTLRVHPRKFNIYSLSEKGVFATRSPDRPNPLSFSIVKLLRKDGNLLTVDKLDVINGTPVIDIKPYIADSDAVFNSRRLNVKTSCTLATKQLFHDFLKENVLKYSFSPDDTLELGICCLIKIAETLNEIPDRNQIKYFETDFTGNALDCLYYHFKFTPGENRIRINTKTIQNSFLKIHFISGEIWKIKNNSTNNYSLDSLKIERIS